jgi:diguanylate cyclase (GGDEF)-like protein
MPESSSLDLAAFPSSPYAAELRRGPGIRPFAPPLEAEYTRGRLREHRVLIRVAAVFGVMLGAARGTEQLLAGGWTPVQTLLFAVVFLSSILLAAVACGPWFVRLYLPFAHALVPLRNALVAVVVAGVAANGQPEALMFVPLLVLGPFFVLGLRFRAALVTVALTLIAYVAATAAFELALPLLLRSSILLVAVAAACAVGALTMERTSRKSFLEGRLIGELAERDALTGLKNRRVFDERLEKLWERATAEGGSIAIVLIDVDHFKAYNDRYGHQAGDRTLQSVAATLQVFVTDPHDLLARYGGEEFAVLLHATDGFDAGALAERMRLAVAALALDHEGAANGRVTISLGVAFVEPSHARRARGALQLADQALYQAKIHGRNRVEIFDQGDHRALRTGVFSRSAFTGR